MGYICNRILSTVKHSQGKVHYDEHHSVVAAFDPLTTQAATTGLISQMSTHVLLHENMHGTLYAHRYVHYNLQK